MRRPRDDRGLSAVHDALLFLTLVALSTGVLAPAVLGPGTSQAAEDSRPQRTSATAQQALFTLLASRPPVLSYQAAATPVEEIPQLATSIFSGHAESVLDRQPRHRSIGSLTGAYLATSLALDGCPTNPITSNPADCPGQEGATASSDEDRVTYHQALEDEIQTQLDRLVGGRYEYRLDATWQPVPGVELGNLRVDPDGATLPPEAPPDAAQATGRVIVPFGTGAEHAITAYRDAVEAHQVRLPEDGTPAERAAAIVDQVGPAAGCTMDACPGNMGAVVDALASEIATTLATAPRSDAATHRLSNLLGVPVTTQKLALPGATDGQALACDADASVDACRSEDPARATELEQTVRAQLEEAWQTDGRDSLENRVEQALRTAPGGPGSQAEQQAVQRTLHRAVHPHAEVTLWIWA